jgi:hypothetical protein
MCSKRSTALSCLARKELTTFTCLKNCPGTSYETNRFCSHPNHTHNCISSYLFNPWYRVTFFLKYVRILADEKPPTSLCLHALHDFPPLDPKLKHLNPVHSASASLAKICFNIVLPFPCTFFKPLRIWLFWLTLPQFDLSFPATLPRISSFLTDVVQIVSLSHWEP